MTDRIQVYVFRAPTFAPAGDTVVTAAPRKAVVAVYGGGGIMETAGLSAAFGGCAVYRQGLLGKSKYHLGIWGERKASKFRQSFRNAGIEVEIVKSPPPGRLILWSTNSEKR
jgi:hypothetical protein